MINTNEIVAMAKAKTYKENKSVMLLWLFFHKKLQNLWEMWNDFFMLIQFLLFLKIAVGKETNFYCIFMKLRKSVFAEIKWSDKREDSSLNEMKRNILWDTIEQCVNFENICALCWRFRAELSTKSDGLLI